MSQKTDSQLTTQANIIKNETVPLANTAVRVGTMVTDIIDSKINNSKITTNTSLGTDDTLIPSENAVKTYVDSSVATGIATREPTLGFTAENVANKQTTLTASATKYPTVNAVNAGLALKANLPIYKVLTLLMSQSGTSTPTGIILENTTGAVITFERIGVGGYNIISDIDLFDMNKVFMFKGEIAPSGVAITLGNFADLKKIAVTVRDAANATLVDGFLDKQPIEIRIYN